jgi:hypothetical protein
MNWLSNLTSIVRSSIGTPGIPVVTGKAKTPLPNNMQFFSLVQAGELLNYEFKNLDVPLIKKGCEIIKAPYIGGGTFWVKRTDNAEEEEAVKEAIAKEIWSSVKAIVVYYKLDRNHPRYSYYQAIAIRSEDLLDLKKAMKIHKLKAFL